VLEALLRFAPSERVCVAVQQPGGVAGGIAEGISLVQELLIRVDPRQHLLPGLLALLQLVYLIIVSYESGFSDVRVGLMKRREEAALLVAYFKGIP